MPLEVVHPDPNIIYRIQNPLRQKCIEFAPEEKDIRLGSQDDTGYQYWRFEQRNPGTGKYFIRNVADSTQYLRGFKSRRSKILYAGNASEEEGTFVVSIQDGAYRLILEPDHLDAYVSKANLDILVYTYKLEDNNSHQWRWQLMPVAPQIHRIRSHDGRVILTMPEESTRNVYARSQLNQSDYQRWIVNLKTPLAYSIQNVGNKLYLGCTNPPAVGHSLVGLKEEYLWSIRNVGSSTWSSILKIVETAHLLAIGFPGHETKDEIRLVPNSNDNTPSQLWFMEKDLPISSIHKRRVAEGIYILKNVNNSTYMNAFSIPWRIIPGSSPRASPYKFELKYIDKDSARFTLAMTKTTASGVLKVAVLSDVVGLSHIGTEFVLLEKNGGDLGYVICLPDSEYPHKVVSGRTVFDINRNQVFAVDNQVPGARDSMQMWQFLPVPK